MNHLESAKNCIERRGGDIRSDSYAKQLEFYTIAHALIAIAERLDLIADSTAEIEREIRLNR